MLPEHLTVDRLSTQDCSRSILTLALGRFNRDADWPHQRVTGQARGLADR